jgi:hypothetical protein
MSSFRCTTKGKGLLVCLVAIVGGVLADQYAAEAPSAVGAAYYGAEQTQQDLLYNVPQRRQHGGGHDSHDQALLLPSILPSLLLLTCGALGAAYFSARLDVIEKEIAERLKYLADAIDHRLDRLEDEAKEGQKTDEKNDFKTKALCKLAGLFNNPLYDICQEGFDSNQIIGPSGHGGDGIHQF